MKTSRILPLLALAALACNKSQNESTGSTTSETPRNETRSAELRPKAFDPSSATGTKDQTAIEPKDPMKAADADMKKVLEAMKALGVKPVSTLQPAEARKQPTPADAVKKVLADEKKDAKPIEMAKVENRKTGGGPSPIDARIYVPKTDAKKPLPVVAYWHGGGFVIADLDTYDASARAIAKEANAIVVSLDYRRAPENKFPAAYDDAITGYKWVLDNAASFGGDPKRVAIVGESAGGNLAANVAIAARDKGMQMPLAEVLVYPVAQTDMNTKSYREWANAMPLDKASMQWFVEKYTRSPADQNDPRINLVSAKLDKLPKTTIVLAEIDPLRSDGEILAEKMKAAGDDVEVKTYDGVTHEFFGMGKVVGDAKDAESYVGKRLKDVFEK